MHIYETIYVTPTTVHPAKIIRKSDSRIMRIAGHFLILVSPKFMSELWTTWGHTIYTPSEHDKDPDWGSAGWVERHKDTLGYGLLKIAQREKSWRFWPWSKND